MPPGWYRVARPGSVDPESRHWTVGDPSAAGVFKYGLDRNEGLFPARRRRLSASWPCSSSRWCSWTPRPRFRPARWPNAGPGRTSASTDSGSPLPYCLYANWVWGGGWLAQMGKNWSLGHGAVDFAGSGVVHAMGGVIALGGAHCRRVPASASTTDGWQTRRSPVTTFRWPSWERLSWRFGWFGFNPGSTLSGTDLRIALCGKHDAGQRRLARWRRCSTLMGTGKKPDPSMMLQRHAGRLGGDHRACAFVDTWAACVIGAVAGVLVV